ncbi:hypothetical protein C882_0132 [Caenispirillum salinarum AK4]|uniref:Transmembrane protein n=1 Tax=Caenispirillum salinarum AK4 TaxID=1238182 RepID=K9HNH1_9PROT|nr:hypothetical protein [Caenispirillum salinarum]EKV30051.1 hypothetical protein C882_0132 [Caenispirillum salinarum AK4]
MAQDESDRRPPDRRPPPENRADRDPPPSPRDPHAPHADTSDVSAATDTGPGPAHHPPPPTDDSGPPTPRGAHGPHAGRPAGEASRGAVSGTVKAVYILYFVGVFVALAVIIGALIAFFKRQPSTRVEQTHYDFQIRTFIGSVVAWIVGAVVLYLGPAFMPFAWAIMLLWAFWIVIRSAKGLSWAGRGEPVQDPDNWLFGGGGTQRAGDVDRRPPP